MLLRKALRSKTEREALSHLSQVLDDEVPGAAKELAAFFRSQQENVDKDVLLTILNTGVVPPQVRNQIYGAYSDFWRDHLWEWVGSAGLAGEAYTGLNLEESAFTEYLDERGQEWATLMTTAQFAAYREVRNIYLEASVPDSDALELMVLATGLAPQDAAVLARQQVAILEKLRKQLALRVIRRNKELLKQRAFRTAEYELARAYNDAKRLAQVHALQTGLVKKVVRRWVTENDDIVCKICGPLNGKKLVAESANSLYNAFDRVRHIVNAPAHIKCRCTVIYESTG